MKNKILKYFSSRYATTADLHNEDSVFLKGVVANCTSKPGENGASVQWFYNAYINDFCIIYISIFH